MAKKIFTDESLATFVDEIKAYTDNAIASHTHSFNDLTDKPFGEDVVLTEIEHSTSEGTVTIKSDGGSAIVRGSVAEDDVLVFLNSNSLLFVEWDEVLYKVIYSNDYMGVGNTYLYDNSSQNTGEPFFISSTLRPYDITIYAAEAGTHTYKIYTGTSGIKQLDEMYIPDTIARTEYVDTALATKADSSHTHDDKYYTESEIDTKISTLNTTIDGKQATITGAATTITGSNLTANRALVSNSSGKVAVSAVTSTELGYLDGVTSAIQTQLDGKVPTTRTINGKALSSNITLSASDVNADISGTAQTKADAALASAQSYTDTKISDLINSAPTTLDTLGEIATAMAENEDVVDALEEAIGTKANASDLTSHTNNKNNPHGVTLSQLGVTATAAELNIMDGVTATTAEINKLDGLTATTAELNYVDGVTSNIQTQLDAKASQTDLNSHANDTTKHITAAERTAWNAAEGNAKSYTDEAVAEFDGAIVLGSATVSMPKAGETYWRDITYGNGKYVMIARYNTKLIAYSTDLINWTTANLPVTKTWAAITYGGGKFVAISTSDSNVALYSTDGINWSQTTLPSSTTWQDVVYGNGKFVAVKNDGYTSGAYSEDGITWNTMSCLDSYNTDADAIGYGNGLFVIPVSIKNSYSTDGITWNFSDIPVSGDWHSIAYGNGKFVAVSRASNKYIYSEDGINWTSSTFSIPATKSYYIRVAFGNGKFVAVAANSNVVSHSTDGVNWSQATSPITLPTYANDIFVSLIYADGKFILMYSPEEQTPQVVISTDGVNWSNSVGYLSDFENNNITDKVKSFVTTGLATETYVDEAMANATATLTPVTTAGTGSAYTATISGITALTVGITITIVPHVVSASTTPTLDLNGLGAKQIRRRLSSIATSAQAGYTSTWLAANKPFTLVYDGTYWVVEGMEKPVAADLYGTLSVEKGGTGATTAEAARANLEVYSKTEVDSAISNAMPTVTVADNGKFLRVVDGVWAATTVPSAEEVAF